ncbi:MAG: NAD(P)-dependent alcohol dehydrogenase [Spirochaetales bacterium]|nr:NAD(P)-dependent alcohol dehydrogenase [Spirochaetales bacterium]
MKAVICTKYGPPDVLKPAELPEPVPKAGEVLIRIHAASVTNSDIFIRGADIPLSRRIPMKLMLGIRGPRQQVIGEVLSGEVVRAGNKISKYKTGDQVYGLTGFSLGAYAEFKCMKEKDSVHGCIARKPGNVSHSEATGIAYGGLLALQSLEKIPDHRGKKILVYGASGTTGLTAIQYLLDLDADVTAVCSAKNIPLVKSFGIRKVLDYTAEASVAKLERYDAVFDAVGIAKTSALKKAVKDRLNVEGLYLSIDDGALKLDSARLDRITRLVEQGKIKPVTDKVFSLDEIVRAHEYVQSGHKVGNVAIKIRD